MDWDAALEVLGSSRLLCRSRISLFTETEEVGTLNDPVLTSGAGSFVCTQGIILSGDGAGSG